MKSLSPSGITVWLENREEFYLRYIAKDRPVRTPQKQVFSVGSAFDAYTKSFIHNALFGKTPEYKFETMFEKQVEVQNRDWAREAGKICFDAYRNSGALADLMMILRDAEGEPQFEFTVTTDSASTQLGEVQLLGKPDAYFTHKSGEHIVLDWKVNGFLSKASPKPGYIMIRDGLGTSRGTNRSHKDAVVTNKNGILINVYHKMDTVDSDWARQLAIYGWLCGEPVGGMFVTAIDQLACDGRNKIRVAEHRNYISADFQLATYNLAQRIWNLANSDHYFDDVSKEESQERCAILEKRAGQFRDDDQLRKLLS